VIGLNIATFACGRHNIVVMLPLTLPTSPTSTRERAGECALAGPGRTSRDGHLSLPIERAAEAIREVRLRQIRVLLHRLPLMVRANSPMSRK
jgi:hypothetical protein